MVFRPSNGTWYVKGVGTADWSASTGVTFQCGQNGDIPLVGNVLNDGNRAIVYRPSQSEWCVSHTDLFLASWTLLTLSLYISMIFLS